jgi:hypothetical protein
MMCAGSHHLPQIWLASLLRGTTPRRPRIPDTADAARSPARCQADWHRGFGDNARVLKWIFERITGAIGAVDTPIGTVPKAADLDVDGLELDEEEVAQLLRVDLGQWLAETKSVAGHLAQFGDRLPPELTEQLTHLRSRVTDELAHTTTTTPADQPSTIT